MGLLLFLGAVLLVEGAAYLWSLPRDRRGLR